MSKINRNFKASVFTHLFGEPAKELELYNAFSQKQYPPETSVVDLTLTNTLYMDQVNDLSFCIGGKLVVFFEHQSSINENMPLRDLLYCGRVYEKLIDNAAMFSVKRVTIPTPEFYVLYNGIRPFPDKAVYRLSDSFAQPSVGENSLELIVNIFNVNKGYNDEIIKRSQYLQGYVTFVAKVRDYERSGLPRSMAVEKAIKECIEEGILADYLRKSGSEVSNMLLHEWNMEDAKIVWQQEAREEGKEEGKEIGKEIGKKIGEQLGKKLGEERSDLKWKSIIAEKDAQIAELQARLANSKS